MAKIRKFGKGGATPKKEDLKPQVKEVEQVKSKSTPAPAVSKPVAQVQKPFDPSRPVVANKNAPVKEVVSKPAPTVSKPYDSSKPVVANKNTPVKEVQVSKPVPQVRPAAPVSKPYDPSKPVVANKNTPVKEVVSKPAGTSRTSGPIAKDPEPVRRVTNPAPTVSKPYPTVSNKPDVAPVRSTGTPPTNQAKVNAFTKTSAPEAKAAINAVQNVVRKPVPQIAPNVQRPASVASLTKPISATMKKGGKVKSTSSYKSGGSVSGASKRGDGIAQRGKTRGKMC